MGITSFWGDASVKKVVTEARVHSSKKLGASGFKRTDDAGGVRGMRVGIDTAIWLFHAQHGSSMAAVEAAEYGRIDTKDMNIDSLIIYHRLVDFLSSGVLIVLVFDGPQRPKLKRRNNINTTWESPQSRALRKMAKALGIQCITAAGEAEAELANLCRLKLIDAVLTDDADTFAFGAPTLLRIGKKNDQTGLVGDWEYRMLKAAEFVDELEVAGSFQDTMILAAVMCGGDYLPEGLPSCGPITALSLAKAGYATRLCDMGRRRLPLDHPEFVLWRAELRHELATNERKLFTTKKMALAERVTDAFPNLDVLDLYLRPAITTPPHELDWDAPLDLDALGDLFESRFGWDGGESQKRFRSKLWLPICVREMREAATAIAAGKAPPAGSSPFLKVSDVKNESSTGRVTCYRVELDSEYFTGMLKTVVRTIRHSPFKDPKAGEALRHWIPCSMVDASGPRFTKAVDEYKQKEAEKVEKKEAKERNAKARKEAKEKKAAAGTTTPKKKAAGKGKKVDPSQMTLSSSVASSGSSFVWSTATSSAAASPSRGPGPSTQLANAMSPLQLKSASKTFRSPTSDAEGSDRRPAKDFRQNATQRSPVKRKFVPAADRAAKATTSFYADDSSDAETTIRRSPAALFPSLAKSPDAAASPAPRSARAVSSSSNARATTRRVTGESNVYLVLDSDDDSDGPPKPFVAIASTSSKPESVAIRPRPKPKYKAAAASKEVVTIGSSDIEIAGPAPPRRSATPAVEIVDSSDSDDLPTTAELLARRKKVVKK